MVELRNIHTVDGALMMNQPMKFHFEQFFLSEKNVFLSTLLITEVVHSTTTQFKPF